MNSAGEQPASQDSWLHGLQLQHGRHRGTRGGLLQGLLRLQSEFGRPEGRKVGKGRKLPRLEGWTLRIVFCECELVGHVWNMFGFFHILGILILSDSYFSG